PAGHGGPAPWWPDSRDGEEAAPRELPAGQPGAPSHAGAMTRVNRDGPPVLGGRPPLERLASSELAGRVNRDVVLVDTRPLAEQRRGSVPGALSVPGGGSFATYAAYVIDPETERRPLVLFARDQAHAERLRERLTYVGIDDVMGYVTELDALPTRPIPMLDPAEAK